MPEYDKERVLGGETSVTPSSDAAIITTIEGLKREHAGLPDPEIIVDGETLSPVTGLTAGEEEDILESTKITNINPKLDHTQSRFGFSVRQERLQKKAA